MIKAIQEFFTKREEEKRKLAYDEITNIRNIRTKRNDLYNPEARTSMGMILSNAVKVYDGDLNPDYINNLKNFITLNININEKDIITILRDNGHSGVSLDLQLLLIFLAYHLFESVSSKEFKHRIQKLVTKKMTQARKYNELNAVEQMIVGLKKYDLVHHFYNLISIK